MTKSHVSMERKLCPVCGTEFDSGAILLDTRLHDSLERYTVTGYGLCPTCQERHDNGYVALVAVKNPSAAATLTLEQAYRTGDIAWMRRSAWAEAFGVPIPADANGDELAFVFCEPALIATLQSMTEADAGDDNTNTNEQGDTE